MREYDEEMTPVMQYPISYKIVGDLNCPYNKALTCEDKSKCGKCGWNPSVDAVRRVKTRDRLIASGWMDE